MTYSHDLQPAERSFNLAVSQRACQTCRTTVTSQWRYGLSGKVLLCNACGIRWKRKNRTTDKRKLKPGPKRTRQCTKVSSTAPYNGSLPGILQPSLSSLFYKPSMYSVIRTNISSSSTITDPRAETTMKTNPRSYSQQQSSTGYARSCSKMDLGSLVCPTNSNAIVQPDATRYSKPSHSSPISISNLLNFADDDGASTVCSTTTPYTALRC